MRAIYASDSRGRRRNRRAVQPDTVPVSSNVEGGPGPGLHDGTEDTTFVSFFAGDFVITHVSKQFVKLCYVMFL